MEQPGPGIGPGVEHLRRQAQPPGRGPDAGAGRARFPGRIAQRASPAGSPSSTALSAAGSSPARRCWSAAIPGSASRPCCSRWRPGWRAKGPRRRLCFGRGIGRAGAAARDPARAWRGAGSARRGDQRARHPDHAWRRPSAGDAGGGFDPDHAFGPDRGRSRDRQPGPRKRAGTGPLRQGAGKRGGARRPCHQGRRHRRPARARTYGRHGAELRGRAKPPVPNPPRVQEPLRRDRRDRRVRDGRGGAERGSQPVGPVPDQPRRAGQRHQRVPGDRGIAAGAGRIAGADREAGERRDPAPGRGRLGWAGWRWSLRYWRRARG